MVSIARSVVVTVSVTVRYGLALVVYSSSFPVSPPSLSLALCHCPSSSLQNATQLEHLYIQIEHTDVIRNFRCRDRIPGLGNAQNAYNIPSRQSGMKV